MDWEPWKNELENQTTQIGSNDYSPMLTYQLGDFFIMSDDYLVYYAYLAVNSEYAPCYVIGEPHGAYVEASRPASQLELEWFIGMQPPGDVS